MAEYKEKTTARNFVDLLVSVSGIVVLFFLFCFGELDELEDHDAKLHPEVKSDTNWRMGTKVIAWIDIIYTCIGLFFLAISTCCGSLALCCACVAGLSGKSRSSAGGGESSQNKGNGIVKFSDKDGVVPCVLGTVCCVFSVIVTVAVLGAIFQIWVTLKLLKSTEIGRDVHESMQLVKIWLIVTSALLTSTVLHHAVNKEYGQIISNCISRGIFIFVACMFHSELKSIAGSNEN